MPQEGTFRYDTLLTDFSIAYSNPDLVAERVAPIVPVDNKTDRYRIWGPENLVVVDDRRAPGAETTRHRWKDSSDTYYCDGHGLKDGVPRENQNNTDPSIDLLMDTTMNLTDAVARNKEAALVAKLVAGMSSTSLAAQTATHWDNDANDPVAIIRAQSMAVALRTGGVRPNLFTVSLPVWHAIVNNANVKALASGAQNAVASMVTPQQFARLIGVDEVLIASGTYNSANMAQTAVPAWIWGEKALLSVRPRVTGRQIMSLINTFVWRRALQTLGGPGATGGNGYTIVERYWWQLTHEDMVEVHSFYDQKIVAMAAGCLFTDCLT